MKLAKLKINEIKEEIKINYKNDIGLFAKSLQVSKSEVKEWVDKNYIVIDFYDSMTIVKSIAHFDFNYKPEFVA